MNRGAIPGFYFDNEKQKYFKIQANHQPAPLKYSDGNVNRERRQAKKRKRERAHHNKKLKETVKRNRVTHHRILGTAGLQREHGTLTPSEILGAQDETLAGQLQPRIIHIQPPPNDENDDALKCAHYVPSTRQMLYALKHSYRGQNSVSIAERDSVNPCLYHTREHLMGFHGAMKAIATSATDQSSRTSVCICTSNWINAGNLIGTVHLGQLGEDGNYIANISSYGGDHRGLFCPKFSRWTQKPAVLSSSRVRIFDMERGTTDTLNSSLLDREPLRLGPSVDWLDAHTVAFEANHENKQGSTVRLWDTRTPSATATRFPWSEWTTGLICQANVGSGTNENHILISSTPNIFLVDKRMPQDNRGRERHLMTFYHRHGFNHLPFATDGHGLMAAGDGDFNVMIWSTRTGRYLGELETNRVQMSQEYWGGLQWFDDERGDRVLQAWDEKGVLRWQW